MGAVAFTVPPTAKGAAPQQGRVDNVRLARPRFTLEPGGRYRASADLSLGGGVLGQLNLGQARAAVVATNEQIQLNDFVADLFNGSARGSATIATSGRASSSVQATFENVDAGGLVALTSGNAVPLTGAATGTVDLRFPGTNFKLATGRVDATFEGATGRDESARTPLTGQLALTAERGTFNIERANLRAGATELTATGRFSFEGGSDLNVNLNSSDAAELQTVALSTGLLSEFEEKIKAVGLAGNLRFNGYGDRRPRRADCQRALRASVAQPSRARPRRRLGRHRLERDRDAHRQRPPRRARRRRRGLQGPHPARGREQHRVRRDA